MDDQLTQKLKSTSQKSLLLWLFLSCIFHTAYSQGYTRADTIPVNVNGNWLKNPWGGGFNYIQVSDIDMNFDGKKDLFIFDRTGHKITTYINKGTPNTVDYADSTFKYASKFPHLEDWALIRDYNKDGKPDILTYGITVGGIKVWRNTSSAGNLQFTLLTPYIRSDYTPFNTSDPLSNLYVSRIDIPTLDDIDGDGDMDVLTFDFGSPQMEYHINQSVEKGYGPDSLIFNLDVAGGCWGNFNDDAVNCSPILSACRTMDPGNAVQHAHPFTPPFTREQEWENALSKHEGNCSLCLDMDADGDKEILLGQISCCNLSLLTNGGSTSSANMTAKTDNFPGILPVSQTIFPCGYFVDVNNDNKRDIIVCPNAPNISLNTESIWYYKNTGTDNTPVFSRIKRNLFQEEMIDVGEGADPVFFDFDADGLTDLLVSSYMEVKDSCPSVSGYNVHAFKNTGTPANPRFNRVSTDYADLSTQLPKLSSKHLTFGDTDGDGDPDMYIGDYNGNVHCFTNTAGPAATATFTYAGLVRDFATPADTFIDVGSNATPQLIDADRDGDIDLIIGERMGNLNFYENTGTANVPVFSLTDAAFGHVDVMQPCCAGYSVPFMYDSAGKYNLVVGSEASRNYPATGWIWYYKDIDANLSGSFTLVDSLYNNIWEGQRMTLHGTDINADGKMDLVIGNYAGGVTIYMGDSNAVSVPDHVSPSFDFTVFPNPSSGNSYVRITTFTPHERYVLHIYNLIGEIIYSQPLAHAQSKMGIQLAPGVYSCEIASKKFSKTQKLVVIK